MRTRPARLWRIIAWVPLCTALVAHAGTVEIPLRVPFAPVAQALTAQLAASSSTSNVIYQEGPCRYLHYDQPHLEAQDGRLRLIGPGSAALGVELFGDCRSAAEWHGSMEFTLTPQLDNDGRLHLHVVDARITDAGGKPSSTVGFIWDLAKQFVQPRLEQFSFDVGASRAALIATLRTVAPPQQTGALEQALDQLHVLQPRVEAKEIVVPIAFDVPDAWQKPLPPAPPAPPLSDAEIEALQQTLQPWDAFLVYSIKQVGQDIPDRALRERLFELLLDSRYRLVAMLSGDEPGAGDPLRTLFVESWNELRAILLDAEQRGLLDASLLRYATFINAGDALLALDRAAPGLGMRISVDGLRTLARSLRPESTEDPLKYDENVDPQLRQMFDFEALPDSPPAEPAAPAAPGQSWLEPFITAAQAADAPGVATPPLDRWVPGDDELPAYQQRVAALLQASADTELKRAGVGTPYDAIYRNLVPTTGMIESCWHQYVRTAGKVTYLRSPVGSIGLMQINQHVWRGFYNLDHLRWNTAYNVQAGAQILMRYMQAYAIPYADRSGDPNHIPRATYAVYNAGPGAVGRFRAKRSSKREQRVDQRLWALYQGFAAGGRADLRECKVAQANP